MSDFRAHDVVVSLVTGAVYERSDDRRWAPRWYGVLGAPGQPAPFDLPAEDPPMPSLISRVVAGRRLPAIDLLAMKDES